MQYSARFFSKKEKINVLFTEATEKMEKQPGGHRAFHAAFSVPSLCIPQSLCVLCDKWLFGLKINTILTEATEKNGETAERTQSLSHSVLCGFSVFPYPSVCSVIKWLFHCKSSVRDEVLCALSVFL